MYSSGERTPTPGTYSLAANGGVYIVAWGAILYGGIDMIRGLAGLL